MAFFGPPNVEKLKAKRKYKDLVNLLGYWQDDYVRRGVVSALSQIGAPAMELLISKLNIKNEYVREDAAKVLGKIGDESAVEPLIALVNDRDNDVCQAVVIALGQIGDTRAVEPLIYTLNDNRVNIVQAAAESLGKISDTRAVEALIAMLNVRDKGVLQAVVVALGEIGDARAVMPLFTTFFNEEYMMRRLAKNALIQIGPPAMEPFISSLKDSSKNVRKDSAEALDELGWKPDNHESGIAYWIAKCRWDKCVEIGVPAVKLLISRLNDENDDVRQAVADTLGKIGDARAVGPLLILISDRNKDVCQSAVFALGQIGDDWAVEPLLTLIQDQNKDLYQIAMAALGKIGDARAVGPLFNTIIREVGMVRQVAENALVQIGSPAIELLISSLTDSDENVCSLVETLLIRIGTPAVEQLVVALMDSNKAVRRGAAVVLGKLGWKPNTNTNILAYWIAEGSLEMLEDQSVLAEIARVAWDDEVRLAAVHKLKDQSVISELATSDPRMEIRQASVKQLTDQICLAEIAKSDSNKEVRITAVEKLLEQTVLVEIFNSEFEKCIRIAAVDNMEYQTLLSIAAKTDSDSYFRKLIYLRMAEKLQKQIDGNSGDGTKIKNRIRDFLEGVRSLLPLSQILIFKDSKSAIDGYWPDQDKFYSQSGYCLFGKPAGGSDIVKTSNIAGGVTTELDKGGTAVWLLENGSLLEIKTISHRSSAFMSSSSSYWESKQRIIPFCPQYSISDALRRVIEEINKIAEKETSN